MTVKPFKVISKGIKSIKFLDEYRCFKKDTTIFFSNINILVGDQGCGKSTLIDCLMNFDKLGKEGSIEVDYNVANNFIFFDSEKHNPRIRENLEERSDMPNMDMGDILMSRFQSHGETMLTFIEAVKTAKNYYVFIDEPESGLSLRSQYKIKKALIKASKNNCQLFISTHSPILMGVTKDVLSLEHMKFMIPEDFIETQK